jgi:lia operon protein LiaG
VGGLLLTMGLSFAGDGTQESRLIRQEIILQDHFDHIAIDTADCDVKFAMFSGRDDCVVEVHSYENVEHTAVVEDGTLKIKMINKRNWTEHINIGWTESMEMTVYLPAAEYESLQVSTTTGDMTLAQEPLFREVMLRSDTGDISCVAVGGEVLDCMTSTGDISVQNSAPNVLKLQSNTGEVDAENVNVQMFICQTETGDVELEQVLTEDSLQIRTDTGDVSVENCDAGRVDIETNTGDVSGHFLSPKWFSVVSDTGNVRVPQSRDGGECRIETDSGDIHFQ